MSDGTLRTLGVLTALFQGNQDFSPSLIGIEEPETALHPAASAALRDALQRASEHTQVIVTSHSPDLLDDPSLPAETLLAVVGEAGVTRLAPLDEASRGALRVYLSGGGTAPAQSIGARPGSACRIGRTSAGPVWRDRGVTAVVAIVEGDGEVAALPILSRCLGAWLSPDQPVVAPAPIRVRRDRFLNRDEEFRRMLLLAAAKCGAAGWILVLLDADDDCPAELGPRILERAQRVAPRIARFLVCPGESGI